MTQTNDLDDLSEDAKSLENVSWSKSLEEISPKKYIIDNRPVSQT